MTEVPVLVPVPDNLKKVTKEEAAESDRALEKYFKEHPSKASCTQEIYEATPPFRLLYRGRHRLLPDLAED